MTPLVEPEVDGGLPPFDGNDYRKRVLSSLLGVSDPFADPFLLVDVDPQTDDTALLTARFAEVVQFWQKERNSPRYKGLCSELVRRRSEVEAVLADPATRSAARMRVAGTRKVAEVQRTVKLDRLVAAVVKKHGGIPRSRLPLLRKVVERENLPEAVFTSRVAPHPVIEDGWGVDPPPVALRRQVRASLDELALRGDPARAGTLYTYLSLTPVSPTESVAERHAALVDENLRRPHDRDKTVQADLLAHVKAMLMTGDAERAAYLSGLLEDAKDRLRDRVTELAVIDGELWPADVEALVQQVLALGWGLGVDAARQAVRQLAAELGVSVTTGKTVEYVVCPGCKQLQVAGGSPLCRYCDTPLTVVCPHCGKRTEAAALACIHCRGRLPGAQVRPVATPGAPAPRAAVPARPAGPAAAPPAVVPLAPLGGGASRPPAPPAPPAAPALSAGQAAEEWRLLEREISLHRLVAAHARAARLARQVSLPGPSGVTAAKRLAELTQTLDGLREQTDAVRTLPEQDRESALFAVLDVAADLKEAVDALAAIDVAPPTGVTAVGSAGEVTVRWQRVGSARSVTYLVTRITRGGDGARVEHSLGVTSRTDVVDGEVPAGTATVYEVVAQVSGRRSRPAVSEPVSWLTDVRDLRGAVGPDGVVLTWSGTPPEADVIVERSVVPQPGAPVDAPLRRSRARGHRWTDADVTQGLTYRYAVSAELRTSEGLVRTPGAVVEVRTGGARPRPVQNLTATGVPGAVALGWSAADDASVQIWAADGPLGPLGADVALAALATIARLVGESSGEGRLTDTGLVGGVYTPVTVAGGRAVLGAAVALGSGAGVTAVKVADDGAALTVTGNAPSGTSQVRIAWRRDRPPRDLDDAQGSIGVTPEVLSVGHRIEAPFDGSTWYLLLVPMTTLAGRMVPGAGTAVSSRALRHTKASYTARRSGWRRRTLTVELTTDGPSPAFALVAGQGRLAPTQPSQGTVLATIAASPGAASRLVEVDLDSAPAPSLIRLVPTVSMVPGALTLVPPSDTEPLSV